MVETTGEVLADLPDETLAELRHIIGQPPLSEAVLARLTSLRCIFNVESNLPDNMPYATAFARGIHGVTTGAVFAPPVAEIGPGFALVAAARHPPCGGPSVKPWRASGRARTASTEISAV